jgi:cytochrome c biogenesis protein CcmG/thiol:disulfide interchange protein DsbE
VSTTTETPVAQGSSIADAAAAARRRHVTTSIFIVAAAAIFVGLLAYGLMLDTSKVPPANIDKAANDFRVAFVQGNQYVPNAGTDHFSLADLKGKPLVLNFWATWCVSCREEAHELEKFWEGHKDQVNVVGIAIQDDKDAVKKFAQYFGKTYIIGFDEDGKIAIDYGVSGTPETFLIDKNGLIRHKEIGPVTTAMLEKFLPGIE